MFKNWTAKLLFVMLGWKQGEYRGSGGPSSSSMSKTQMEMRETLRRAGEGDAQIEDADFGNLNYSNLAGWKKKLWKLCVFILRSSLLRLETGRI